MEEGVASLPPTEAQKKWFPKAADRAGGPERQLWVAVDVSAVTAATEFVVNYDEQTFDVRLDDGTTQLGLRRDQLDVALCMAQ